MSELSDRDAVLLCHRGLDVENAGFLTIYDRHAACVFRFLRRLLGDQHAAEDALQETFVRLYRGIKSYDPSRPLRPYLFSIARNVAVNFLEARSKRPKPEPLAEGQHQGDAPAEITSRERDALIAQSLAALAPEHRSLLALRHMEGLTLDEIAEGSACTDRTVRNRLRVAASLFERELRRRGVLSREVKP